MPSGKTTGRVPHDPAKHAGKHHEGFNDALEQALSQLSTEVGPGKYNVTVQFEAEVDVSNPGKITGYSVTLAS
jgi:hypothetical protein